MKPFKWQNSVILIEKRYREATGENASIGLNQKGKTITAEGATYTLNEDLQAKRQEIYQRYLEAEYDGVINMNGLPEDIVPIAKKARSRASKAADDEFFPLVEKTVKSLNLGKNDELDLINKLNDLYVGNMAAARDTYYTVGFKEAVKLMIECIH